MERRYRGLCEEYGHTAKVVTKTSGGVRNTGNPDLLILFTNTMSHKMLRSVLSETKGRDVIAERCHTSSMAAFVFGKIGSERKGTKKLAGGEGKKRAIVSTEKISCP